MSKRKWMKILISHKWGSPSHCYNHPDKDVKYVVHEKIDVLDLRDYYREYGEQEFPRVQQRAMRKVHPKQAEERYLCSDCYRGMYLNNDLLYDLESGQAEFTSIEIELWRKKDYMTVEEAVQRFLIKPKGK